MAAFTANTRRAPEAATRAPPMNGPATSATLNAVPSNPLAQGRSSVATRLGMAAADAARNGAPSTVAANAAPTSSPGACVMAIAR